MGNENVDNPQGKSIKQMVQEQTDTLQRMVGKTIQEVVEDTDTYDGWVRIKFTDGTEVKISASDGWLGVFDIWDK